MRNIPAISGISACVWCIEMRLDYEDYEAAICDAVELLEEGMIKK